MSKNRSTDESTPDALSPEELMLRGNGDTRRSGNAPGSGDTRRSGLTPGSGDTR